MDMVPSFSISYALFLETNTRSARRSHRQEKRTKRHRRPERKKLNFVRPDHLLTWPYVKFTSVLYCIISQLKDSLYQYPSGPRVIVIDYFGSSVVLTLHFINIIYKLTITITNLTNFGCSLIRTLQNSKRYEDELT
jgi:hypothetical protein